MGRSLSVESAMDRLPVNKAEGLDAFPPAFLEEIRAEIEDKKSRQSTLEGHQASEIIFNAAINHDIGPISLVYVFQKTDHIHRLFDDIRVIIPEHHNGYDDSDIHANNESLILDSQGFLQFSRERKKDIAGLKSIQRKAVGIAHKMRRAISAKNEIDLSDVSELEQCALILGEYIDTYQSKVIIFEANDDAETVNWYLGFCRELIFFTQQVTECAETVSNFAIYSDGDEAELLKACVQLISTNRIFVQYIKDELEHSEDALESAEMFIQAQQKALEELKKAETKENDDMAQLGKRFKEIGEQEALSQYLLYYAGLSDGYINDDTHISTVVDIHGREIIEKIPPQAIQELICSFEDGEITDIETVVQRIAMIARRHAIADQDMIELINKTNIIAHIVAEIVVEDQPQDTVQAIRERNIHIQNVKAFIINDAYELYWCHLTGSEQERLEYFERRVRNTMMKHGDRFEVRVDGLCHLIEEAIFIDINLHQFLALVLSALQPIDSEYLTNHMQEYRERMKSAGTLDEAIDAYPISELQSMPDETHVRMNLSKLLGVIQLLWYELYTSYISGTNHVGLNFVAHKWMTEHTECNLPMPSAHDKIIAMSAAEFTAFIAPSNSQEPESEEFLLKLIKLTERDIERTLAQMDFAELSELSRLLTFVSFAYDMSEIERNKMSLWYSKVDNQCLRELEQSPARISALFLEQTNLLPAQYFQFIGHIKLIADELIQNPEYKEKVRQGRASRNETNMMETQFKRMRREVVLAHTVESKKRKKRSIRGGKLPTQDSTPSQKKKKPKSVGRSSGKNGK